MKQSNGGFDYSYNAQTAVDAAHQIIVAAELTDCAADSGQLPVMAEAVERTAGALPERFLADAGYRSEAALGALAEKPCEAIVALGREGREHARINAEKYPHTARMAAKLESVEGKAAYRRRKAIVEAPNGWIKAVVGFRQFSLRGIEKVRAEWKLVCLAMNHLVCQRGHSGKPIYCCPSGSAYVAAFRGFTVILERVEIERCTPAPVLNFMSDRRPMCRHPEGLVSASEIAPPEDAPRCSTRKDMSMQAGVFDLDNVVSQWWNRKTEQWLALPWGKRLYVLGLTLFLGWAVTVFLRVPSPIPMALLLVSGTACAVPLAGEIYAWLERRRDTLGFKIISGVSTVMAGAVAAGMSSAYVASATGQEPGTFKFAVALMAPLAFIPIFALVLTIAGTLSIPVVLILTLGADAAGLAKEKIHWGWWLARFIGLMTLAGAGNYVAAHAGQAGDRMQFLGAYSAFLLDMQVNPTCGPLPTDRVARINEKLVIVGRQTADGVVFVRRACSVDAQSDELPPPRPTTKH